MAPGEQGPPETEVKRRLRGDADVSSREAGAAEAPPRRRARLVGLLLMIVSSIIALMVLYGVWRALRAL